MNNDACDRVVEDNRGLAFASAHAQKLSVPLVVLFVLSPGDYKSHDRSPRRIDFALRNLEILQVRMAFRRKTSVFMSNATISRFP